MEKLTNEIYALVDEEFISKFNDNHRLFIEEHYYKVYVQYCGCRKRKALSKEEFYTNMHRRRIQLYQLCCPYCGEVYVMIVDKKISGTKSPNYCPNCGRGSAIKNIMQQLARFRRINWINRLGLKEFKQENPDTEDWILAYDCYQMELIELASIIEVVCRDYFEALLSVNTMAHSYGPTQYVKKIIKKHNGNDFMNIEKANNVFKKAFEIDLRAKLDKKIWNDLVDIVNLRNMMIHNNGRIDKQFKNSGTYKRWNNRINGNLFRLEDKDIKEFFASVVFAISTITSLYLEYYYSQRNIAIANYYFNEDTSEDRCSQELAL